MKPTQRRQPGSGAWRRLGLVLLALLSGALSGCDGFFFDPGVAPSSGAVVSFQPAGPLAQPGLQDAFDRVDAARIVLRQSGAVLFDGTVALQPVPGGLAAELELETDPVSGAAVLQASLTAGGDPLLEGQATLELVPGLPVDATVPLTLVDDPPEVEILAPAPGTVGVEGVALTFLAVATDKPDGDITDRIVWRLNGDELDTRGGAIDIRFGAGDNIVTATVTDDGGTSASASRQVTVLPSVSITTLELPAGRVDASYSATLTAAGGDGSYLWSLAAGLLPPGLTLDAAGLLSGIPVEDGSYTFTAQVASAGATATREFTVLIDRLDPPIITVEALPDAVIDIEYDARLTATGGDGLYAWRLVDGFLPEGLALFSDGTISGVPSGTLGVSSFTVEVESAGQVALAELSIRVVAPLSIDPGLLPDALVGLTYSFEFTAFGGDGLYEWAVIDGDLPPGLSLDPASGLLAGVPTEFGTYLFTVQVTSAGETATRNVQLLVDISVPASDLAYTTVDGTPGFVRVLDRTTRAPLGRITVGSDPVDLVITPNNQFVVVANAGNGSLSFISTSSLRVVATVPLGGSREPSALAVSPDGSRIYAASFNTDDVVVVDIGSTSVVSSIPVGAGPTDLVVSQDGNDLFVVNNGDGSVSIVDLLSGIEVDTILGTPADQYLDIALDPNGFEAYVTALDYVWHIQVSDAFEIDRVSVSGGQPDRILVDGQGRLYVSLVGASPGVATLEMGEGLFQTGLRSTPGPVRDLDLAEFEGRLWVVGGSSSEPYVGIYNTLLSSLPLVSVDLLPEVPYRLALPPGS